MDRMKCKKCTNGKNRQGDCKYCAGSGEVVITTDEHGKKTITPAPKSK